MPPVHLNPSSIPVPLGWKRLIQCGHVEYFTPDSCKLTNVEDVYRHILARGTCKCGLKCPFKVEEVFNFDPTVATDTDGNPDQLFPLPSLPDGRTLTLEHVCRVGQRKGEHTSILEKNKESREGKHTKGTKTPTKEAEKEVNAPIGNERNISRSSFLSTRENADLNASLLHEFSQGLARSNDVCPTDVQEKEPSIPIAQDGRHERHQQIPIPVQHPPNWLDHNYQQTHTSSSQRPQQQQQQQIGKTLSPSGHHSAHQLDQQNQLQSIHHHQQQQPQQLPPIYEQEGVQSYPHQFGYGHAHGSSQHPSQWRQLQQQTSLSSSPAMSYGPPRTFPPPFLPPQTSTSPHCETYQSLSNPHTVYSASEGKIPVNPNASYQSTGQYSLSEDDESSANTGESSLSSGTGYTVSRLAPLTPASTWTTSSPGGLGDSVHHQHHAVKDANYLPESTHRVRSLPPLLSSPHKPLYKGLPVLPLENQSTPLKSERRPSKVSKEQEIGNLDSSEQESRSSAGGEEEQQKLELKLDPDSFETSKSSSLSVSSSSSSSSSSVTSSTSGSDTSSSLSEESDNEERNCGEGTESKQLMVSLSLNSIRKRSQSTGVDSSEHRVEPRVRKMPISIPLAQLSNVPHPLPSAELPPHQRKKPYKSHKRKGIPPSHSSEFWVKIAVDPLKLKSKKFHVLDGSLEKKHVIDGGSSKNWSPSKYLMGEGSASPSKIAGKTLFYSVPKGSQSSAASQRESSPNTSEEVFDNPKHSKEPIHEISSTDRTFLGLRPPRKSTSSEVRPPAEKTVARTRKTKRSSVSEEAISPAAKRRLSQQEEADCNPEAVLPEGIVIDDLKQVTFQTGSLVWAKGKSLPFWPGVICSPEEIKQKPPAKGKHWVRWLGDVTFSSVEEVSMRPLAEGIGSYATSLSKKKGWKDRQKLLTAFEQAFLKIKQMKGLATASEEESDDEIGEQEDDEISNSPLLKSSW